MRGILFKLDMIKAIGEGRKTQTRRINGLKEINREPDKWTAVMLEDQAHFWGMIPEDFTVVKPRYRVGETVYIKEVWATDRMFDSMTAKDIENTGVATILHFIKILDVRVERLREITPEDCIAEGIGRQVLTEDIKSFVLSDGELRMNYVALWDKINPKDPFASNPWCFVYLFEKVK